MSIKVVEVRQVQPISVNIDGECNHAATHTEIEEFDEPNPHGQDVTIKEMLEVCDKCGAYRDANLDGPWSGVTAWPL